MLVPRTEHLPARPSWDCIVCGHAWPCADARSDLAGQYEHFPAGLAIYMASMLYEAVEDLAAAGDPTPAELYQRFLAWVG